MGTRCKNILALNCGASLSADMEVVLKDALVSRNIEGELYAWESNMTPLWARHQGNVSVYDLKDEVTLHTYLGGLKQHDFLFMRTGDDGGTSGAWTNHPFSDMDEVQEVQAILSKEAKDKEKDAHQDGPVELNEAQKILLRTYGNGDFAEMLELKTKAELAEALETSGEGLLRFLMVELDTNEHCEDLDDAYGRVGMAMDQLRELQVNILSAMK